MNGNNYDDNDDIVVLQQGQDETEKEQSVPPIAVRSNVSEEETAVLSAAEAILPSPAVPEMKGSSSFLGSFQCGGDHFMMDDDGDEDNGEVVLQQGQDETGKELAVLPITVTSNGCVSEEETPAVLSAAEEILEPLQCRNHFMMDDDDLVVVLQQGQDKAGKEQVVPPIAVTSKVIEEETPAVHSAAEEILEPVQCGNHFMMDDDDLLLVLQQGEDETEKEKEESPIASNLIKKEATFFPAAGPILPPPGYPVTKGSSSCLGPFHCGGNHFVMDNDKDEDDSVVVLRQGQDETGQEQAVPPSTVTSNVIDEETPAAFPLAEPILLPPGAETRSGFLSAEKDTSFENKNNNKKSSGALT
ncbi:hypothetical protein ACA910_002280 [Epithemia clementina (nom. ined.)]